MKLKIRQLKFPLEEWINFQRKFRRGSSIQIKLKLAFRNEQHYTKHNTVCKRKT